MSQNVETYSQKYVYNIFKLSYRCPKFEKYRFKLILKENIQKNIKIVEKILKI